MKRFHLTLVGTMLLGSTLATTAFGDPPSPARKVAPTAGVQVKPAVRTKAPTQVAPSTKSPAVTAAPLEPPVSSQALKRAKAPAALDQRAAARLIAKGSGLDLKQVRARGVEHKVRLTPRTHYQEGQAYLAIWYPSEYDPQKNLLVLEREHNGVISVRFMPDKVDVPYLLTIAVSTIGGESRQTFTWNVDGTEQNTEVRQGTHNISVTVTPKSRSWHKALFYLGEGGHAWRVHSVDIHAVR